MLKYLHMVIRKFWQNKIKQALQRRSIVWLSGIRRVGKTNLCRSLDNIEYIDCELPRMRQMIEDAESFFADKNHKLVILDEIHRLDNPSEVLKIAADHYPQVKIIATGSSTLGASAKFKDTLTGRKTTVWLTPLLVSELETFENPDLKHRFLCGGLPSFFLTKGIPEQDFQEWLDAYWAKDILELFRLERQHSFKKFVELLLMQSGGIFEATRFAKPCEVSRVTITNYLSVLEATHVAHIIRPFSSHRPNEIIAAPKVYGFDTGFICHTKGWTSLRPQDLGILWEHLVLNEIQGQLQTKSIYYWRDKQGHEIDFIYLKTHDKKPVVIECKWSSREFEPNNLQIFRNQYPDGKNFVVAADIKTAFTKKYKNLQVNFTDIKSLLSFLQRKVDTNTI
jgi:uncharacterized protein